MQDKSNNTSLYFAVYNNSFSIVKKLLDKKANVNIKGEHDMYPLHLAAKKKKI